MAISAPVDIGKNIPVAASPLGDVAFATTVVIPAGGKLLFAVGWLSGTATLSSVSAAGCSGAVSRQVMNATNENHFAVSYLDAPSGLASGSTVTATFSDTTAQSRYIAGSYVEGAATGAEVGGITNTGNVAAWTSTGLAVDIDDLLYGGADVSGFDSTSSPSGGNVEIHDFAIASDSAMTDVYQIGTGAAIASQGTWFNANPWASVAAIYAALADMTPIAAPQQHTFAPAGPF